MRDDDLNLHGYYGYMEITDPSLNVCFTDEDKWKRIIVYETLSQSCSANEGKSKQSIVNKTLSQNYSADVDKLSSTKEVKSECTIMEQKDAEDEVTYDNIYNFNVSNVFECRINNPDVSYKRAHMATERN